MKKLKITKRVFDTQESEIIDVGTVIERDNERAKAFKPYSIEVNEPEEVKPKKKTRKKKE